MRAKAYGDVTHEVYERLCESCRPVDTTSTYGIEDALAEVPRHTHGPSPLIREAPEPHRPPPSPEIKRPVDGLTSELTRPTVTVTRSLVFPAGSAHPSPVTGRDQSGTTAPQERRKSTGHPWSVRCDEQADRTVRSSVPVAFRSCRTRLPGMGSRAPPVAGPRPRPRLRNHRLERQARANSAARRGLSHEPQGTP